MEPPKDSQGQQPQQSNHPELDVILDCFLHDPETRSMAITPTFEHRLNIAKAWGIPTSTKALLDIGCGQGESSLTLAATTPPGVHVTGIDSAPPDYGSPTTLAQSQAFILNSPLGKRITFERADPVSYLQPTGKGDDDEGATGPFDAAVFCHSLWYWSSVEQVRNVFAALARRHDVSRIYIAEWAGTASRPDQEAHVLAATAQKKLFALRPNVGESRLLEQNIRTALFPDELFDLAADAAGWKVARRGIVTPPAELREGVWETDYVKSDQFFRSGVLELESVSDEQKKELLAYQDRVKEAVEECGGRKNVKCMDVVWAVLERGASSA